MKEFAKSTVKRVFGDLGIDIKFSNDYNPRLYRNSLEGAISVKKPFNIIQVGANDGKHTDPIYDFVKEHSEDTKIVLIEPIETIIPYLKENYSYHPSSEVVNKAIGQKEDSLKLYGVKKEFWDDVNAEYGQDWPTYRVPTGVTTSSKNRLVDWVANNTESSQNPEEIIEQLEAEVVQPSSILRESSIINDVQLLQVDAEGMDDEIVYSFLNDEVFPNIINIENRHLDMDQQEKYHKILSQHGYDVVNYKSSEIISFLKKEK